MSINLTSNMKSKKIDHSDTIPVVFCTYHRLQRLSTTLGQLSEQENCKIRVYIWNNNQDEKEFINKEIKLFPRLNISVYHSKKNIGGYGRFYLAKKLSPNYSAVVFIDDDINLNKDTISTLIKEYKPKNISAVYSFKFTSQTNYFRRSKLKPGEYADYCSTSCMIADSSVFKEKELFNCPKKYWYIEDLWLSYYANHKLGWSLMKSGAKIVQLDDNVGQWRNLKLLKSEFLQYLIGRGWNVANGKPSVTIRIKNTYEDILDFGISLLKKNENT